MKLQHGNILHIKEKQGKICVPVTDVVSCQSVYNDHSDTHIGGSAIWGCSQI